MTYSVDRHKQMDVPGFPPAPELYVVHRETPHKFIAAYESAEAAERVRAILADWEHEEWKP
jgi:hypothetical protein